MIESFDHNTISGEGADGELDKEPDILSSVENAVEVSAGETWFTQNLEGYILPSLERGIRQAITEAGLAADTIGDEAARAILEKVCGYTQFEAARIMTLPDVPAELEDIGVRLTREHLSEEHPQFEENI